MLNFTAAGCIGKDCTVRELPNSTALSINFKLAVRQRKYNPSTSEYEDSTIWLFCSKVVQEGKDGIKEYLKKGQYVAIQGEPHAFILKGETDNTAALSIRVSEIALMGRPNKKDSQDAQNTEVVATGEVADLPW